MAEARDFAIIVAAAGGILIVLFFVSGLYSALFLFGSPIGMFRTVLDLSFVIGVLLCVAGSLIACFTERKKEIRRQEEKQRKQKAEKRGEEYVKPPSYLSYEVMAVFIGIILVGSSVGLGLFFPQTPDTFPPSVVLIEPLESEITFIQGETNHSILWEAFDTHPSGFNITRNGTVIESGTWISTELFEVNSSTLGSLEPGFYNFSLIIWDIYMNMEIDTVLVTVTPVQPSPGIIMTFSLIPSIDESDERAFCNPLR